MTTIKAEITPEEFINIYHDPDAKLASLLDHTNNSNQVNVPRAISISYATALIQNMEQDSNSLCSSEEEPPKTHKPQTGMMQISPHSPNQEESQQTTPNEAKIPCSKPKTHPNSGPNQTANSLTAPSPMTPTQHLQN